MASIDLGMVTAYAYAVAGGYTGSEQDFEDLLGNIAIDLEEIENLSVTVTTLPEGSQATASYNNGVLSLGIPKGDTGATGAEGPEGPTGPTGNGIQSIAKTGTSGNVDTYTITYTNGQTTTFTVTNGSVTSVDGQTGDVDLKETQTILELLPTDTASGDPASFPDGANSVDMKSLSVSFSSGGGINSVVVYAGGANYADQAGNGFIDDSGADSSEAGKRTPYFAVSEGNVITCAWENNAGGWRYSKLAYYDSNKSFVSMGYNAVTAAYANGTTTQTVPSGVAYARFASRDGVISQCIVINTYTCSLGNTYNDGTVDLISGILTSGGQTYNLIPQQIKTVLGENNIWSDNGSVSVTYKADIQKYIDKKYDELSTAIAAL